ncbi:MAG: hypothetical protein IT378_04015, partial [Sandaracinaceae bacterium]|nr:hypothetical protein [Sandaracinaceae bacterium]
MKLWHDRVARIALALFALGGCGEDAPPAQGPRVHVVSFAPEGTTFEPRAPIEIAFDAPVVPEAQVGRALERGLVALEPSVEHTSHWRDRQTLVVRPSAALAPGTRYGVTLTRRFPAVVPDDEREHAFVHHPIASAGLADADDAWFPPSSDFGLRFTLPVAAREAAQRCTFASGETRTPIDAVTPDQVATTVMLRPRSPLTAGTNYDLACPGLRSAGGNAAIEVPVITSVRVHPAASIVEVSPSGEGPVTPDELEIVIRTATPVPLDEIRRHVRLTPEVRGLAARWTSRDATSFHQTVNLDASQRYTLEIAADLTDQFGQRLGQPFRRQLQTTDASPRVHMETGIYAVEAASRGYPIWSRNVRRMNVRCAYVPPARIPEILTTTMDYDPWYSDGQHEAAWEEHGLRPVDFAIEDEQAINRWQLHDVDLTQRCGQSGRRGLYLAEVRSPDVEQARHNDRWWHYPYRVLANVTNFGVLLKVGPSSGLVWVTELASGAPVSGANVTVYDPRGQRVHRARTDADGIARMPGSRRLLHRETPARVQNDDEDEEDEDEDGYDEDYEDYSEYRAQRMIVVVEKGGDVAALDGNWANGIQLYNFGLPRDTTTGGETAIRGLLLSDRGIYRPGEQVHFKGFVREVAVGGMPRVPRAGAISMQVEDAEGTELVSRRVRMTPFGGFSFSYRLDPEAPTGDYFVRATIRGHTFRERFSVEEFRPIAFEVTERPRARPPAPGEEIELAFNASYLFGAPLARAQSRWQISRRRRFLSFPEYPSYTFEDWSALDAEYFWSRYARAEQSYVTDGRAQTDDAGNLAIRFRDRASDLRGPQDYLIDVRVTDPTDQSVGKRSMLTVHPTDVYLGLHTQEYVQAVGMPFAVNAVAVDTEGRRVASSATLAFVHRRRRCAGAQDGPGSWDCPRQERTVWTRELSLSQGGITTERINPTEPGEYVIRLSGRDRAGREVSASSMVWVIGEGEAFWSGDESVRMSLIASRDRYQIGDTARLVPQASLAGATALVTLERDGVLDARLVRLAGGVSAIEVPLTDVHAPNVFVSVAAVRGRTGETDAGRPIFRMGVSNLEVSPDGKRLEVEISTERQDYRPGETVNGTVRVRSAGQPVQAELSLSVADEGVLQLVSYQTPDPLRAFYRPWSLGVESATNWNRIARQRPPLGWEDEEDGDDQGDSGEQARSRFVSSAFWAPALVTDANGQATFSFQAPDNLTSFRLMTAVADGADRFGSAERRIRIRKELMVTPILPRFAGEGDRMQIGATVHNETDREADVRVDVRAPGLAIGTRQRTVRVRAHGVERVLFDARVTPGRSEVRVRLEAHMGEHADIVERTLPVRGLLVSDPQMVLQGFGDEAVSAEAEVSLPDGALAAQSTLELTIDRTGLASLAPSLRYLIEYPYGCLEQVVSSLVPLFATRELAAALQIPAIRDQQRLRTYTRLGVAKVVRQQHGSGLFSFWPSSQGEPGLSAYALFGLSQAERGTVQQRVIDSGLRGLRTWANASSRRIEPGRDGSTMAMVAYLLALHDQADAGLNARLFEARASLDPDGKAFLLRALTRGRAPGEQTAALVTDLESAIRTEGERASVPNARSFWYDTTVRTTAVVLSALIEAAPEHAAIPRLVRGLTHARTERGHWRTTQDNAFALLALADYARARAGGATRVTVRLGEATLCSDRIEGSQVVRVERSLADLRPGTLHIESDGPVTYAARLVARRPAVEADAASRGFTVRREYLDFQTHLPIEHAQIGQLVTVRVAVTSDEAREHVALVDPLPAGLEVVNTALATERLDPDTTARLESWRWQHVELRDDEARAFA